MKGISKHWSFIVILVAAAALRIYVAVSLPVMGDATAQFAVAREISRLGFIPVSTENTYHCFWAPPLFHAFASLFFTLNILPSLVSVIFGMLTIIMLYVITNRYFDRKVAIIAVLLLSFHPLHLLYSSMGYVD